MHYTPHVDYAFASVEHIIRDVKYGWFIRYLHSNGASFFFIVIYLHIFRSIYHASYAKPRHHLWVSGIIIFIIMIATAFLGYVLPWGQISFWGATVITNLFSAIPLVGKSIVIWLWGGFSVDNATLNRFFSFHYLLPFLMTAMVFVHLALLHSEGSNTPIGTKSTSVNFYPYFLVKDLFSFFILISFIGIFIFFWPNTLGHPDNYIPANPIKTPAHIVPEWYFLPFYAILRSIPDKLGGVLAIGGALGGLLFLPRFHQSKTRTANFRPAYKYVFFLWLITFFLLAWLGQKGVADTYVLVGRVVTAFYFIFLFVGIRRVCHLEI